MTISSHAGQQCQYYATIESNQHGAVNLDAFDTLQDALRDGNQDKITDLLQQNKISKINFVKKLCVISEAFYKRSSKVSIPGTSMEYWVDSGKLSRVE